MKHLLLLLFAISVGIVNAQSDNCTGVVPTLAVGAGCTPTNYNIAAGFADNFSTEPSCGTDYRDGFFQFTATGSSTTITLTDATPAGPNPGFMVLTGTCGGTFTEIACSENGNGVNEVISIPTVAGTVYTVVIFRSNNATANDMLGTICVQTTPQGASCANPQPITIGTSYCNTNNNAGNFDDNEITSWNPCNSFYSDGEYWYSVVGTGQALSLNMSGLSGSYSGVFIYNGCPSSGGACIGQAVAGASTANYSANTPVLTAGVTYYIAVINWSTPYSVNYCLTANLYSGPVVASDCANYVNICSNAGFQIDPNGYGAVNEIPPLGSLGNPDFGAFTGAPAHLGGSTNAGCLRIGESNSTWMVVNVYTAGNLAFSFGAGGAQAGYYDWIMYPYSGPSTCAAISGNTLAPVRCNWNSSSTGGTGLASTLPPGGAAGNYEPPLAVAANTQYIICFSNFSSATSTVPMAFSGTATVGCSALGNDLSYFQVETNCDEKQAIISWQTPSACSNTYQVQKSYTGEIWEILGTVSTPVSSDDTKKMFAFRDELESDQIALYRLKEIKSDNVYNYTELKSVICKSGISPNTLSPNPSSDLTNLSYYSKAEGTLHIFDALGREINQISLENTKGQIVLKPIDVSNLQNGVYRFVLDLGTEASTIQFIKK